MTSLCSVAANYLTTKMKYTLLLCKRIHARVWDSGTLTVCCVKIEGSPVAALPRGHKIQNERNAPPLQLIIVAQKNI